MGYPMSENPFDFEELFDEDLEPTTDSLSHSGGGGYLEKCTRHKILVDKLLARERKLTKKNGGLVPVFRYHDYQDIYKEYK